MRQTSLVPDFAREVAERRSELKRDAAKRLLTWGFAPADISIMTGCDSAWIEEHNEERLRPTRR